MATTSASTDDKTKLPHQIVTRTAVGGLIQISVNTGQPFTLPKNTTLNEAYNILADLSIGSKKGSDFLLKYFGIGIRGNVCIGRDSIGVSRNVAYQHQPIDHNAFTPIPFIVRPLTNDLEETERAKYRMRYIFTKGTTEYAAYYLKLIDFTEFNPGLSLVNPDGVFIPDSSCLHPEPIELTTEGTVPVSDQYVAATGIIKLGLDLNDLEEVKNACRIVYGDAGYGILSEYYICWGYDTKTEGKIGTSSVVRYDEVLSATVMYHVTEAYPRDANANSGIPLNFDIGMSSPMLLHTDRVTDA